MGRAGAESRFGWDTPGGEDVTGVGVVVDGERKP